MVANRILSQEINNYVEEQQKTAFTVQFIFHDVRTHDAGCMPSSTEPIFIRDMFDKVISYNIEDYETLLIDKYITDACTTLLFSYTSDYYRDSCKYLPRPTAYNPFNRRGILHPASLRNIDIPGLIFSFTIAETIHNRKENIFCEPKVHHISAFAEVLINGVRLPYKLLSSWYELQSLTINKGK